MRSGITRRWLRGSLLITVLLVLLIGALLPILRRAGLVDKETPQKITW